MGTRVIERAIARKIYERFSARWREDQRSTGRYGTARAHRKPTFHDWYDMHLRNRTLLAQSTPRDVMEHLHLDADPWAEAPQAGDDTVTPERGVLTVPIGGDSLGDD